MQRQDGDTAHFFSEKVGIDVKHPNQPVAVGVPADETGHRRAQMARANQNGSQPLPVAKQQFADFGAQHIHLVADALLAKSAKTIEILAHLAGRGAHHMGQFAGRNFLFSISRKVCQVTIVFGQALDYRKGNLVLNRHVRVTSQHTAGILPGGEFSKG